MRGAEHTQHNLREERKKKEKGSDHIWWLRADRLQASDWRLKCAWICAKLGEPVLHLEYFDLVSWFEDWLSRASDLIGVLLVRVTAVSAQSSFGR